MRKTGLTKQHNRKDKDGKVQNSSLHGFVSLSVCALTVLTVTGGCKLIGSGRQNQVYAASEQKSSTYTVYTDDSLPTGIAGVVPPRFVGAGMGRLYCGSRRRGV